MAVQQPLGIDAKSSPREWDMGSSFSRRCRHSRSMPIASECLRFSSTCPTKRAHSLSVEVRTGKAPPSRVPVSQEVDAGDELRFDARHSWIT